MIIIIFLLCISVFAHAYEVGTAVYHVIDSSRKEIHNQKNFNHPRELVLQIWYPTIASNVHAIAPYLGNTSYLIKKNMSYGWERPVTDFDYLDNLLSNSLINAPIHTAHSMYPLLIFSPGFGTPYQMYTHYFETLARNDFIVVAISHTYNCNPTVFPDGRIVEQSESFKNPESNTLLNELETWVDDIRFVINQMEIFNSNQDHPLSGKIDTHNIGIFGHSFGGAAAMRACQHDQRIRACINMDGRLENYSSISVPLMILLSDPEANPNAKETRACAFESIKHAINDTYCFMINHGTHYSFSDDTILTNYQYCTVEGEQLVSFIPFLISSFFTTYLHHQENKIFRAVADYQPLIKQYFIDIGKEDG